MVVTIYTTRKLQQVPRLKRGCDDNLRDNNHCSADLGVIESDWELTGRTLCCECADKNSLIATTKKYHVIFVISLDKMSRDRERQYWRIRIVNTGHYYNRRRNCIADGWGQQQRRWYDDVWLASGQATAMIIKQDDIYYYRYHHINHIVITSAFKAQKNWISIHEVAY